jgi:signal transduction histidine kinase
MARRVAIVAVASASAGGLLAALLGLVAVDQLIAEHTDQRLQAAVTTLAGELEEEQAERAQAARSREPSSDSMAETLADENQEIASSGIRLAVFTARQHSAGDGAVPYVEPGACETSGVVGGRLRACARAHGPQVLVAAQPSDDARLRWWYVLAAVTAVALGAGGGALSSRSLTRWAVAPLTALAQGLSRSRPEGGKPLDLGVPSDCQEVEAIRDELLRLLGRIQQLLEQAQRFAADAAHELRTPLATLRAELELHAEEASDASRPVLERASARVVRLSELIERLLVLALPGENLRRGFETVALVEVVQSVVDDLPQEHVARLRLELESEGLVRGDEELLRSLVSNAIGNALRFAPQGEIQVRLIEQPSAASPTADAMSPGSVCLAVLDRGPGIPEALRDRVFEAFYRAEPGATAGHGIGLALVGHIARVHGGEARFLPSPRGALLQVTLPAWSGRPAEPGTSAGSSFDGQGPAPG